MQREEDAHARAPSLRAMLLGPPLTRRLPADGDPSDPSGGGDPDGPDPTLRHVDAHLRAVGELLPQVYGDTEPSRQARMEFEQFLRMGHDHDAALCKRAALLFALAREKEVGAELEAEGDAAEAAHAADMRDRVLPFILPRFVRNSCQAPDAFVVLACVLSEMWQGEPLGNWPLWFERAEDEGGSEGGGEGSSAR